MTKKRDIPHREAFEGFGETHVKFLAESRTDDVGPAARAWLEEKRIEREVEASSKRDVREEETLEIAKNANRLASEANAIARLECTAASRSARYAMYAAIIAAIGAIAATKDQISMLISILLK